MPPFVPISKRIEQAHALIQKAREVPILSELGWRDLTYIAQVKDSLRKARDLVNSFITAPALPLRSRRRQKTSWLKLSKPRKKSCINSHTWKNFRVKERMGLWDKFLKRVFAWECRVTIIHLAVLYVDVVSLEQILT